MLKKIGIMAKVLVLMMVGCGQSDETGQSQNFQAALQLPTDLPQIDFSFLSLSGTVYGQDLSLLGGAEVRLMFDIDRDGGFSPPETASTVTDANGAYVIEYKPDLTQATPEFIARVTDLVNKVKSGDIQELFKEPVAFVLQFSQKGYSTAHKKLTIFNVTNKVDAVLFPLVEVRCGRNSCLTPDGTFEIKGLRGDSGISSGYARAFDPASSAAAFPGDFRDSSSNILLSSGFFEVDFRDANGNAVTSVNEPVTIRTKLEKDSWKSLADVTPGNDRIDITIFSFDKTTQMWVPEQNGHLETSDGTLIPESDLPAILAQTYTGELYSVISTTHFSSWNTDQPRDTHSCIKGQVFDLAGQPVSGATVRVEGVTYNGWTLESVTGPDGYFAAGVMRSTSAANPEKVIVMATVDGNQVRSDPIPTPVIQKQIVDGHTLNCAPAACDCQITTALVPVQAPHYRVCPIAVTPVVRGVSRESTEDRSSEDDGSHAPVGTKVTVIGSIGDGIPVEHIKAKCDTTECSTGEVDDTGVAYIEVPVIASRTMSIGTSFVKKRPGFSMNEYFSGRIQVPACADDSVVTQVELPVESAVLNDLDAYMKRDLEKIAAEKLGCGCNSTSGKSGQMEGAAIMFLPALLYFVRRRKWFKSRSTQK